jgi:hypothetical protein
MHVVLVRRGGLLLELIEMSADRLHPRSGDLSIVFERAGEPFGLGTHLLLDIGDLGAQFLNAGMLSEQRRRLFCELRAQGDMLLRQPPQHVRIDDVGEFRRRSTPQCRPNRARLRFGVCTLPACDAELRVELAELLV